MDCLILVQHEDFDLQEVYAGLRAKYGSKLGALAAFVGLVRDLNPAGANPGAVSTLTLEHYPGMTERSIRDIVDQADAKWPLLAVRVVHRVGTLLPSDQIVLVVAASAHRQAAFAATEFIMDYLKTDAVFWKKEHTATGEHWVESTANDLRRSRDWRSG